VILLLMGPPGSGKGTQAARIAGTLGVPHVATGDILRAEVARGSELGREVQPLMDAGALVPDSLVVRVIESRLREPDARDGVLLDGFPRTLPQARELDAMLRRRGLRVDAVVLLRVPDEELFARMERRATEEGRRDDLPETFGRRLQIYRDETAPLVDHYRTTGARIAEVDGVGSIDDVTRRVADALVPPLDQERAS
jgi:adenylate kinase